MDHMKRPLFQYTFRNRPQPGVGYHTSYSRVGMRNTFICHFNAETPLRIINWIGFSCSASQGFNIFLRVWSFGMHAPYILSADDFNNLYTNLEQSLWSACPSRRPENQKTIKVTIKWLKSDFEGSAPKWLKNDSECLKKSLFSHFRVTLVPTPQSHFFVTLIVLVFGPSRGACTSQSNHPNCRPTNCIERVWK